MPFDAIIVGGSFAGLSAAMYLARARRTVCVIDSGQPRNRFAVQSHGFFGQDGSSPQAMLETARAQVLAYPSTYLMHAQVSHVSRDEAGLFVATLADGTNVDARKLVLAYGLSDELPPIDGLAEHWGRSVLHCPYCHGYEFTGRQLGVLHTMPMSSHQAMLIAEWGPTVYYLNGAPGPEPDVADELCRRGVRIEPARLREVRGDGQDLTAVVLEDGRSMPVDAMFLGPRTRFNSTIATELGCAVDEHPLGSVIRTDDWKLTTVPGVYAAGDITRGAHSVTWASADGVTAGVAVHRALVF